MERNKLGKLELNQFRMLFEGERKKILNYHAVAQERLATPVDQGSDPLDVCAKELEAAINLRLRNREVFYLRKIDEALERISDGTFGQCLRCCDGIEVERLFARPTATLCFSCKEAQESQEVRYLERSRKAL